MYSTDQLQGIKRLRFARIQRACKTRSQISQTRFARGVNAHQTWHKRECSTNAFSFPRIHGRVFASANTFFAALGPSTPS